MFDEHPTRRAFLRNSSLAALGLLLDPATGSLRGAAAEAAHPRRLAGTRPNILLILADDLGYSDLGCYGAEIVETPNLDRLGFGGMRFTQFYNCAKCAPTRASLLTGLYNQQVGCHGQPVKLAHGATIAEALRPAGYRTWMTGKWHALETPAQRGFERNFALCEGHCGYWDASFRRPVAANFAKDEASRRQARWSIDDREIAQYTPDDPNFFTTDAFTDHAIGYLREAAAARDTRPFFLYTAYNAPHFPLHAPPEDIAKYRGRFLAGWDEHRARRHRRQVELGLIDPRWKMLGRDEDVPAWQDVTNPEDWDLRMAVYAAMIDRLDRNVGRLLAALRETGHDRDTLVLFLSDNGGSDEDFNRTPDLPPGPAGSYRTLERGWANVANTPFRKFKSWTREGGISMPCIAHWPGVIPAGQLVHDVGHVIDFMPTFLELAGASYPKQRDGEPVLPAEGRSFVPLLEGRTRPAPELLAWQFSKYSAVRRGNHKAVRDGLDQPWCLYDVAADRTETDNLAAVQPELTQALARDYEAWAKRVGARTDVPVGAG